MINILNNSSSCFELNVTTPVSPRSTFCFTAPRVIHSNYKGRSRVANTKTEKSKESRGSVWQNDILDWTTAWVCSEVPDAMLVRAQAASNWREGL